MSKTPVALVTGAGRGIGRAIAGRLAAMQFAVVVNYSRSAEAAQELVRQITGDGGQAMAAQCDVGNPDDRRQMVQQVLTAYDRIDVLVNNAGITSPGRQDLLETTEENWDVVFDTNLKGPFFLSQIVARSMIERIQGGTMAGGKIINISSLSAYAVSTNRADYCMTKAAMGMMTQLLAVRLADQNIQLFEICPGVIDTEMTAPVHEKYDRMIADGLTPIRRWGQPDDVAAAVSAIVADHFAFSTGQRFHIDGGFHIRTL